MVDKRVSEEAINLQSLSIEELFQRLGDKVTTGISMASDLPPDEKQRRGRSFFYRNTDALCTAIDDPKLREFFCKGRHYDYVEAVSVIADIIVNKFTGFPPVLVSVIAIRLGIFELCRSRGFFRDDDGVSTKEKE